jgi:hypothetical protein
MIIISDGSPAQALAEQGELRVEISGSSMRPLLRAEKNTVHLRYLVQAPKPLDVVLFVREDGSYVLHRIIRADKGTYTLRGDNQIWPERGISRRQIIGRMEGYYSGERYRSCSSVAYWLYSRLWTVITPLRGLWFSLRRRLFGGNP